MAAVSKQEGLLLTCDAALKEFILQLQEEVFQDARFLIEDLGYCPVPAAGTPIRCSIYETALKRHRSQQQAEDAPSAAAAAAVVAQAESEQELPRGMEQYLVDPKVWPKRVPPPGQADHPLAHYHLFVTKHVDYGGTRYPTGVWLQMQVDDWQDSNSFQATQGINVAESDEDDV